MLYIVDFKTDDADDIIITDDIEHEESTSLSAIKVAERRISSRFDDMLLDSCSAGIERYIQSADVFSKNAISYEIVRVLSQDNLFKTEDYKIKLSDLTKDGKLFIGLRLDGSLLDTEDTFQIIINLQNQQSYR